MASSSTVFIVSPSGTVSKEGMRPGTCVCVRERERERERESVCE
jgi:hypothetical protein